MKYHSDTFINLISLDLLTPHYEMNDTNSVPTFPVMYFNARSLINKHALLQSYAMEIKPKLIAITETWAKPEMRDGKSIFSLPGYSLLRDDRHAKRGGGVMIYISSEISSSQVSLGSFPEFEFVCCKLRSYH